MSLTDYAGGTNTGTQTQIGSSTVYNSISSVQNYVNGVSTQYVLQPVGMQGIAGFLFDYEGDDQIELSSEITDHWAEDNSSIQDHIALKPYRITLRGFVSEVVLPAVGSGILGTLTKLQSKMGTVQAYLGKYTPQALQKLQGSAASAVNQAQNYANTVAQYLNQAQNIAALFGGNTGAQTRQQQAFATLSALRSQRQIFNVLTPWSLIQGVAIETLTFIQPKESKTRSDIVIVMKQMRFVDIGVSQNKTSTHLGRAGYNYQGQSQNGSTPGTPVSLLSLPQFQPGSQYFSTP